MEAYEGAALLLTVLGFPESQPNDALDQRYGEICAYLLRVRSEEDPGWCEDLQRIRPMHAFIALERAHAVGKDLETQAPKWLRAGEIAAPFILKELTGEIMLPPGVARLSKNAIAEMVAEREGVSSATNVLTRSFRNYARVLHFCIAADYLRRVAALSGASSLASYLMADIENSLTFANLAQLFEGPILSSKDLPVEPDTMLRVRVG